MSGKPKKVDPNYVSQRVQQTKKEIEQLKLELQKLINRGIETDRVNTNTITVTDDKDENKSQPESKTVLSVPLLSSVNQSSYNVRKPSSTFAPKKNSNKEEKDTNVSPKKVRHYNVEETREYMKRQKEKRMEKFKLQMQASQNVVDTRKEKLKELQKKSLELVQKNIHLRRDRSGSRDKKKSPEKNRKINPITLNGKLEQSKSNNPEGNAHIIPDLILSDIEEVPIVCSNKDEEILTEIDLKNICVREDHTNNKQLQFDDLVKQYRDIHHKAAIKIQSYYRGYRQRKLFEKIKKRRKKRLNGMVDNIKPALNMISKEQHKEIPADEVVKNNVPFWLQTAVQPYPYNFISTVKKKLNLATSMPIKTSSDIGVQISIDEPEKIKRKKTKDEIKKAIEESIKSKYSEIGSSFLSHKHFDLNVKNVEDLYSREDNFHDLKNDCDITKISENLIEKRTHSKIKSVELLISETSESDTSKNIPDISSESTISTAHSTNHNKIDMSDYKLEINLSKLKNIKLNERKQDIVGDTMLILNENRHKDSKILLKEVPQISEYNEYANKRKSENIKSRKAKRTSSAPILEDQCTSSNDSIKSESVNDIIYQKLSKSDTNVSNPSLKKSKSHNTSEETKKSDNYISTVSNLSKLRSSRKSNHLSSGKTSQSVSEIPILLEKEELKKGFHTDIESDENLKSFREYMTSLEDSRKSRKSLQKKSSSARNSQSFKTLPSKTEKTSESIESINNSTKVENENSIAENYSSNFSHSTSVPLLKRPSVTLTTSEHLNSQIQEAEGKHSISIKPGEIKCIETKTNTNQIHLKFEAELHLLNDFNESLRQFMAVEKSLHELHGKSQQNITIYQNQDTQTTIPFPSNTSIKSTDSVTSESVKSRRSEIMPTINYHRGCDMVENHQRDDDSVLDIPEELQQDNRSFDIVDGVQQETSNYTVKDDKSMLTGLELSQLNESVNSTVDVSMSNVSFPANDVSFNSNAYVGFSVGMFDQLIGDEDARIENLKTILKIREKALLDRTKGELAWLEIQKKQLIETGQLHEASLLKKKQRGIIIKLQHEKQEMQRLKQIQKAASKERKTILKEQRNMIKAQLSNNNAVPKIRRSVHKERRHLGPVKVYNLHRETINTETSISRRSSVAEEIIITSRSESIVGQISQEAAGDHDASMILNTSFKSIANKRTLEAKKSLLMREAALQKRKKAAEELLQWHQRLLEEERKIAELEMAANTIIKQVPVHVGDGPCKSEDEKYDFKGSQLNFLWTNMTGRNEKKFKNDETYSLNQITLEKFCTDARKNLAEDIDPIDNNTSADDSSARSRSIHTLKSNVSDNSIQTDRRKSISNVDQVDQNHDNTSSYSSEFDSGEIIDEQVEIDDDNESNANKSNTKILVNEIDRSKSTLNEIMQNISNITDEISAIYKLSSVANTIKDESVLPSVKTATDKVTNNDIIREDGDDVAQGDESENDTLKLSVQSEIVKSLTELISSQNACQDIQSKRNRNIIETPESAPSKNTLTDSQGTLASNIELYTDSNKPRTETNDIIVNEGSEPSVHTDLNKKLSQRDVTEDSTSEGNTEDSRTEIVISVDDNSGDINDHRKENNQSVKTEMCSVNNTSKNVKNNTIEESQINKFSASISKSEIKNVLDLSYGFTGVRTKKSESISDISVMENDKTSVSDEFPTENGFCDFEPDIDNNKIKNEYALTNLLEINVKNNSISDKFEIVNNIRNSDLNTDPNKSLEATTISTESGFEKSIHEQVKDLSRSEENLDIDIVSNSKLSSPIETSDLINNNNDRKLIIDESDINADIPEEKINLDSTLIEDVNNSIKSSNITLKLSVTPNDSLGNESVKENVLDLEEIDSKVNREGIVLNLEKLYSIEEDEPNDISKGNDNIVNVKQRVSEILADTTPLREDKSPRLQDIYTTTYDILSPEHSPEIGSPVGTERNIAAVTQLFDEEAEALFKKQLAIEQEIKQLEQQQKEHIPYMYMREIPNKPPPPYTPPGNQVHTTVLPSSVEQLHSITSNISEKLYKAYEDGGSIENTISNINEEIILLTRLNVERECYEFLFDLCREFAIDHYRQFTNRTGPSWTVVNKKSLAKRKAFDRNDLKAYLFKKTKEVLGFEKVVFKEKMITKWSRKKRDHVDEILVIESQAEESEWTNYDDDEVIVKNELTNDIMNMLLGETANVISMIFKKKMNLS